MTIIYSINGATSPVPTLVIGIILMLAFIWQEQRAVESLMTLKLFKDRERSSAYLARFFFLGAMIPYFFLTPQAMQNVYHFTPLLAALGFLPETVPQFIFATLISRLNERFLNTEKLC